MSHFPFLQDMGILSTWRPDMGFVDTSFANRIDFYISFGIGLTLAVTFSQLGVTAGLMVKSWFKRGDKKEIRQEPGFLEKMKQNWNTLITRNKARGDMSVFVALAIYLGSTFSWYASSCASKNSHLGMLTTLTDNPS